MDPVLVGVHPDLLSKWDRVCAIMHTAGCPIRATQGLRTTAQQQALYAQGRTTSGPIVTNADGVTTRSRHQSAPDGWGHAIDAAFMGADPYLDKDPRGAAKWALYGAAVQVVGCVWGGAWASFPDRPHMELPRT